MRRLPFPLDVAELSQRRGLETTACPLSHEIIEDPHQSRSDHIEGRIAPCKPRTAVPELRPRFEKIGFHCTKNPNFLTHLGRRKESGPPSPSAIQKHSREQLLPHKIPTTYPTRPP